MQQLPCIIRFRYGYDCLAIKSIVAGYRLLEKQGIVKIVRIENDCNLRSDSRYCHEAIVEVEIGGKKLAYDLADGYQSIHTQEMFDNCLDGVDFYFKLSCKKEFQRGMRNENKVFPSGFSTVSNCVGNPMDKIFFNADTLPEKIRAVYHYPAKLKYARETCEKNFLSHNTYDSYKPMYWTRLWDPTPVDPIAYNKSYPYLSAREAVEWAQKTTEMIATVNRQRIEIIRNMREHFGNEFVYGLYNNEEARQLCPELIMANPLLDERRAFLNSLKQNYICIGSYGMHYCTGAKISEFMAAGRAFLMQPQVNDQPAPIIDGVHYSEYADPYELPDKVLELLNDIDKIKSMEKANYEYYTKFCMLDKVILNTLRIAFPDNGLGEYLS